MLKPRKKKPGKHPALNDLQKQSIIEMYCEGYTMPKIAEHFSVSKTLIGQVLKRYTTPAIFALFVENEQHRKLYGWLKSYSHECGLTVCQMIYLLIQKEMNRSERGN